MVPTTLSGDDEFEAAQATEQGPVLNTKTKQRERIGIFLLSSYSVSPRASPCQPACLRGTQQDYDFC